MIMAFITGATVIIKLYRVKIMCVELVSRPPQSCICWVSVDISWVKGIIYHLPPSFPLIHGRRHGQGSLHVSWPKAPTPRGQVLGCGRTGVLQWSAVQPRLIHSSPLRTWRKYTESWVRLRRERESTLHGDLGKVVIRICMWGLRSMIWSNILWSWITNEREYHAWEYVEKKAPDLQFNASILSLASYSTYSVNPKNFTSWNPHRGRPGATECWFVCWAAMCDRRVCGGCRGMWR